MDIITDAQLASWLGVDVTPGLTLVVDLTNDLVTEAWETPADPVPARVKAVALGVAARAASNPKGLTSWTLSWDDVSRTERTEGAARRFGLFLTDEDRLELNGEPGPVAGTIHTPTRDEIARRRKC